MWLDWQYWLSSCGIKNKGIFAGLSLAPIWLRLMDDSTQDISKEKIYIRLLTPYPSSSGKGFLSSPTSFTIDVKFASYQ